MQKFIGRSKNSNFSIKRVRGGLTDKQKSILAEEANRLLGIYYCLGFDYDNKRQFCSKFVEDIYRKTLNIRIGRIETFKELLSKNENYPLWFWKFWFLGRIPWQRRTVSPGSQYESELLETIEEQIIGGKYKNNLY